MDAQRQTHVSDGWRTPQMSVKLQTTNLSFLHKPSHSVVWSPEREFSQSSISLILSSVASFSVRKMFKSLCRNVLIINNTWHITRRRHMFPVELWGCFFYGERTLSGDSKWNYIGVVSLSHNHSDLHRRAQTRSTNKSPCFHSNLLNVCKITKNPEWKCPKWSSEKYKNKMSSYVCL